MFLLGSSFLFTSDKKVTNFDTINTQSAHKRLKRYSNILIQHFSIRVPSFLFASDKKRILKRNSLRDSFSPSRRSINVIQFVQLGRPELYDTRKRRDGR